ncbi:hypothetical protein SBRCBS47491_007888 [Sporothrix bragantina]|uniref:Major facilitator superfamily (MFS) profile domain-containing protein n=1 Tax=Sporothrix bragantina TaxID=671064 RepID=A0ABP0CJF9_9PEZI
MVDAKADTVGVHVEDARNLKDVNAVIAQDTGFAEFTRLEAYVNELSPPQIRGTLMCFYGFFYAIGQLFAAVVLYVVENNRPLDWRIAVYTEWAFHGLWIVFGFIWLPESPVYYVRKGQTEKAKKTLNRIYKGIKGFDQDRELRVLQMEVDRELEASTTSSLKDWLDLFKGTNRLRTLGAGLAISTQIWSGCNLVFSYTTYFIQEAGIGEAFTASLIVTCVLIAGLLTSFVAVEALGRRPLLLGGCICCTICNLVIGITGCFPQTPALNNAALAFIFLWVFSYGTAFAGVCWALTSEGASARLKTQTAAFATLVYDVASLVFTVAVPYMIGTSGPGARNWGTRSVFMYFISCAAATVGNYFLCPETKGRTQAEIDEMYENKIPPRKFAKYVSELQSAKAARAQL